MAYGTTSSLAVARRRAGIAGAIAMVIGAFWLAAWLLGFASHWSAHFITVKANMALGQVLAGAALLLLAGGSTSAWRRRLAITAGAFVLFIGVATLSEHLVGWNLGIDQLLATEPPGAVATASPNRIGLPGSTSLALLGAGLLALAWGRRNWAAPYLGLTVCLIVLVPLVGFLYGIHEFYGKGALTGIAWPSTIALLLLGIGLMLARPEAGPVSLLLRQDAGGVLLRRMLPAVVLVPLALGFLRVVGQYHGLYGTATGTGFLVISLILIFSAMLWRSATHLSRSAATQRQAEAEIRSLAQFPEDNPNPVLRAAEDGTILYANRLAKELVQTMGGDNGRILPQPLLDASRRILDGTSKDPVECEVVDPHGRVWSFALAPSPRDRHVNLYGRNVTERKRAEREREITIEFLSLVNQSRGVRPLVEAAVRFFHQQSGCQAVGIRLRQGDDYPYYEVQGFPEEFVRLENSLCVRDPDGQVQRDAAGDPVMACMCGNVICGRFDPSKSFFTPTGSFWANDTTRLLATTTDADRQTPTRNRCNGEGYESVALIALRYGQERMGLLQLNDRRKGMFSAETIALWERLTGYLAVALANVRAEEALRESERLQRLLARVGELAGSSATEADLIEAIGAEVASELGVSRCGFSRVDVEAGKITVTSGLLVDSDGLSEPTTGGRRSVRKLCSTLGIGTGVFVSDIPRPSDLQALTQI